MQLGDMEAYDTTLVATILVKSEAALVVVTEHLIAGLLTGFLLGLFALMLIERWRQSLVEKKVASLPRILHRRHHLFIRYIERLVVNLRYVDVVFDLLPFKRLLLGRVSKLRRVDHVSEHISALVLKSSLGPRTRHGLRVALGKKLLLLQLFLLFAAPLDHLLKQVG